MKSSFLKILVFFLASFSLNALASDEVVRDITCSQRWPWNGKVDIKYTLLKTTSKTSPVFSVKFYGQIEDGEPFKLKTLENAAATGIVFGDGEKITTWDAAADFGTTINSEDVKIAIVAEDITEEATYLKLDLTTYKMTTSTVGPDVSSNAPSKYAELWLKRIEPGTFIMGSATNESGRVSTVNREAEHRVTITKAYYIGVFELTAGQYNRINDNGTSTAVTPQGGLTYDALRGTNYGATWPVPNDHRVDATNFFGKLRAKTGNGLLFDLPTESQWEMASRWKGTTGNGTNDYYGSCYWNNGVKFDSSFNGLEDVAWFALNSGGTLNEVGLKEASTSGLYDMHGNADEWCLDWMAASTTEDVIDPEGPKTGVGTRVVRDGCYPLSAGFCRIAIRRYDRPDYDYEYHGCRVALVP